MRGVAIKDAYNRRTKERRKKNLKANITHIKHNTKRQHEITTRVQQKRSEEGYRTKANPSWPMLTE